MRLENGQYEAVKKMKNGCILNGGVGSGKSITSLGYYYILNGGSWDYLKEGSYKKMKKPSNLYIITTAQKRDNKEWELELNRYKLTTHTDVSIYNHAVVVDSWNNIKNYINVKNAFFIFDEQRITGNGVWVKSFLKIAKQNQWILLTATPGDSWLHYVPVFIANGFYRNRADFNRQHIVYKPFITKYPAIDKIINEGRLIRLRDSILIDIKVNRHTNRNYIDIWCKYDVKKYRDVNRTRWNPYTNEPIDQAATYCSVLRRVCNEHPDRINAIFDILAEKNKAIIFYNYDYELDILKSAFKDSEYFIAEYNGHAHQELPNTKKWVYLVQYTAGNAGWNCVKTDTIIFYSQNYSYTVMEQSCGRIDRLNTNYTNLYYYILRSRSGIDLHIQKAVKEKKKFNEYKYFNKMN